MERILLIILAIVSLMGCSKKSNMPDNLSLKNSKGQVLYLYMPREDAEKILGEAESLDKNAGSGNLYIYDNITIAYKDDTLAYAGTSDDEWSFSSGIKVGDSKDKCQDFTLDERWGLVIYKNNNDNYIKVTAEEVPKPKDLGYGDYSSAEVNFKENVLTQLFFYDKYPAATATFDE